MSKFIDHLSHKLTEEERAYFDARGRRSEILVNDRMFGEGGEGAHSQQDDEDWEDVVDSLTVAQLREELVARQMDTSGNKAELQARLVADGPPED